jgi:hypothetical protein
VAAAWREPNAPTPRTIAIRLEQLTIEKTHAWFGTDVRVDALICTRPGEGQPGYLPTTMRFPRMSEGERAPLDNALLYHGPARDFVDICLWVSRDTPGSAGLAELISARARDPDIDDALTVLATAREDEPWITAMGASAVLARVACDAIGEASRASTPLYWTSFLATEDYGIGRHPRQGLYHASDLSFSLRIEPGRDAHGDR